MPRVVTSSEGVEVVVHHLGAGDGPPVLVAHATGFNALAYAPLAAALGDRASADVFAPDVRGHGRTVAPPQWTVDWHGYAEDVAAAAESITTPSEELFGFGHSMGGAALLLAAHRHPQLFAGLVLFEPVVFPPLSGAGDSNPLADGAARRRTSFPSRAAARENFARKPPMSTFTDAALDGYLDGGLVEAPDGTVTLSCAPALESATYRAGLLHGAWELLPAISVPTLVIGAHLDHPASPAAMARAVADRLAHGTFLHRDDLDHFGPFVDPATVADLIAARLA